ncbi:MAG: sigma-70 family RNA polymerase sigma factor [Phycisphaeraceae bacterium]|nr:sigma-70 family RNA polymerase sigma factor [Phycisphaeraceae bacterium]
MERVLEDRKLIWQAKRGQEQAFARIYQKYLDLMLTVGMSLLGDVNSAEDVVQEVFVQFAQSLDSFQLSGSLKAFLATCVANRARNLMRQGHRRTKAVSGMEPGCSTSHDPVDVMIKDESLKDLQGALSLLPPEQREIVVLKTQAGLSFRALAHELNMSLGTVQSRYRYGIERLRTLLDGEVNNETP